MRSPAPVDQGSPDAAGRRFRPGYRDVPVPLGDRVGDLSRIFVRKWPYRSSGGIRMTSVAVTLAEWAADLKPGPDDEDLARRSQLDMVAVTPARGRGRGRSSSTPAATPCSA